MNKKRQLTTIRIALALVLIVGVVAVIPTFASASIVYVKWNATGANNGTSWTDAYTDLQFALAAASTGNEVWVAAGTYKPTIGMDRSASFTLKNNVAVFGGFAGTETSLSQRDPATHVTTLSGDIGIANDNSDNSYHVVISPNTDSSALLDGVTVTGGNAEGASEPRGGGLYSYLGSPTVRNVTFSSNHATFGGGCRRTWSHIHLRLLLLRSSRMWFSVEILPSRGEACITITTPIPA